MKKTETNKPTPTVPKGVWEASHPDKTSRKQNSPSTDLQGNGYPQKKCPL